MADDRKVPDVREAIDAEDHATLTRDASHEDAKLDVELDESSRLLMHPRRHGRDRASLRPRRDSTKRRSDASRRSETRSPLGRTMLEHVPHWLGGLLRERRAGHEKLVIADAEIRLGADSIALTSPAFPAGGRLPIRFTADGEGPSPPLVWSAVPEGAVSLALIVEDPDAPAPKPLVHAIVWDIPPEEHHIVEGAIGADSDGAPHGDVGRNSFLRQGWLPPDPPTGHGAHDYVFQLFALSDRPDLAAGAGRGAFVDAIAGKVLAAGVLIGTYSRGEPADQNSDASVVATDGRETT